MITLTEQVERAEAESAVLRRQVAALTAELARLKSGGDKSSWKGAPINRANAATVYAGLADAKERETFRAKYAKELGIA